MCVCVCVDTYLFYVSHKIHFGDTRCAIVCLSLLFVCMLCVMVEKWKVTVSIHTTIMNAHYYNDHAFKGPSDIVLNIRSHSNKTFQDFGQENTLQLHRKNAFTFWSKSTTHASPHLTVVLRSERTQVVRSFYTWRTILNSPAGL